MIGKISKILQEIMRAVSLPITLLLKTTLIMGLLSYAGNT